MSAESPANPPAASRVVLLAVDHGPHSKHAFSWFLENMYQPSDRLVLAHFPTPPSLSAISFSAGGLKLPAKEWEDALNAKRTETETLYNEFEYQLRSKNLKSFKIVGDSAGKPGEQIIKQANAEGATLIVMGTRGLGPMKAKFLGSVSTYVLAHSRIPVVICPDPERDV